MKAPFRLLYNNLLKSFYCHFLQLLKDSLAKHPRVKVSGEPPLYSFIPLYDIKGVQSLLSKLQKTGGLLKDDIISSHWNAEKILSMVVKFFYFVILSFY